VKEAKASAVWDAVQGVLEGGGIAQTSPGWSVSGHDLRLSGNLKVGFRLLEPANFLLS
jgi:hypothetical protein